MDCAIFLKFFVVELDHEAHVIDRTKPRTSLLEFAFFKSSNPNFLSRFGTPFLLFLFFILLRDLIVVGEGETSPVGAAIGLLAETETEIEEPQSKAASKSSSASPVKLAKQHKVDIRSVAGTGPFGRITASDVEAAAGIAPSMAAPPPPPPPPAAAKATTTSSSSPPLLPGSSVVPFTAMQSDVSKNMIESLSVPMFRVGYPVNTDALDAPYEKLKILHVWESRPGEELFELPKQHKKRSIHYTKAQRWSTTATGHQQGNNPLVPNKIYSLQPIHVMAGQEISGKLHLVVHRKSVGPGADQGGILHTSSCKLNLKEPYYRMSQPSCTRTTSTSAKVKLASTLDHIGNVAQISPLIGFVHKHVVIVETEPELEKSEFSVMSLDKCVKQLEEERATEETYHHQQRKCKL
ncbi:hypothetical protein Bca52824_047770 [Brassica carinata]|uniref:Peripheral subunit-binding (PSBD) domain-containing protein n=1 Tax=Brassica carinata TaxID=52824 RepID=A0A8X7USH2_BRACI|nr:hypothetical protein Bca52824_047770 [Brassica carinata]